MKNEKTLTREEIFKHMLEIMNKSVAFNWKQTLDGTFKLNSIIYCLEKLDSDYGIHLDINTTLGRFIPIRRPVDVPTYIPSYLRAKDVKIKDIEIWPINEENKVIDYSYLLILEEIENETEKVVVKLVECTDTDVEYGALFLPENKIKEVQKEIYKIKEEWQNKENGADDWDVKTLIDELKERIPEVEEINYKTNNYIEI